MQRLPIIAEDGFRFPADAFYDQLLSNPDLQYLDLEAQLHVFSSQTV